MGLLECVLPFAVPFPPFPPPTLLPLRPVCDGGERYPGHHASSRRRGTSERRGARQHTNTAAAEQRRENPHERTSTTITTLELCVWPLLSRSVRHRRVALLLPCGAGVAAGTLDSTGRSDTPPLIVCDEL